MISLRLKGTFSVTTHETGGGNPPTVWNRNLLCQPVLCTPQHLLRNGTWEWTNSILEVSVLANKPWSQNDHIVSSMDANVPSVPGVPPWGPSVSGTTEGVSRYGSDTGDTWREVCHRPVAMVGRRLELVRLWVAAANG